MSKNRELSQFGSFIEVNDSSKLGVIGPNVGIGTTNPTSPLAVMSSSNPEIRFGYNESQDHRITWDSSKVFLEADPENANGSSALGFKVDGSEALRISSSGNVGIGTDDPDWILHVLDDSNTLLSLESVDTNADIVQSDTVGSTRIRSSSGHLDFFTGGDASSTNATNSERRVRITSAGNIGIGTDNPTATLEVATSVDGEATLATFKNTSGGGTNETVDIKLGLENTVASNVILRAGKEANHGSGAAADNFFAIHTTLDNTSSEKLRITSDGKVRVPDNGKFVAGAGDDLQIYHNGSNSFVDNTFGHLNFRNFADDSDINFYTDDGSGGTDLYISCDGSAERVKLYQGGSVKLSTQSTGIDVTGEVQCDTLDVDGAANIQSVLTMQSYIQGTTTLNLYGDSTASQGISLDADGNVTLQANLECATLDVNGAANIQSVLTMQSYIQGTTTLNLYGDSTASQGISLDADGNVTLQANLDLQDGDKILLGTGDDLQIWHTGSSSVIQNGTGNLFIQGSNSVKITDTSANEMAVFTNGGAVELYYSESKKFETTGIGVSIANGASDTATITGPSNLVIDPAVVGDNTGLVRIKGDLFVDGTTTQINSTALEIADFIVGIATTATTDLTTDGAGIGIGSDKTFLYEHNGGTNPSLKSSENLNVSSGKVYQIDQIERLSANTLSIGTGTTIHSPASNTLTLGTNSTERLRINSTGNIGVGTDNPTSKLDVNGNILIRKSNNLYFEATSGFSPRLTNSVDQNSLSIFTNNTERLSIDASGILKMPAGQFDIRVGDDIDSNAGTQTISVGSTSSGSSGGIGIFANPTNGNSFIQFGDGSASADQYRGYMNYRHADDSLRFGTAGSDRLHISSGGQVGIGTDNPNSNAKLHVVGGLGVYVGYDAIVRLFNDGSKSYVESTYTTGAGYKPLVFKTGGFDRLTIDNDGNVGIGTDNPQEKLHLSSGGQIRIDNPSNGNFARIKVVSETVANAADLTLHVGTGEALRIANSGNIGIGTTNPGQKLHVEGNTAIKNGTLTFNRNAAQSGFQVDGSIAGDFRLIFRDSSDADRGIFLTSGTASTGVALVGTNTNNRHLGFAPGDTEKVRITSNGRLGIGTNNPGKQVHIESAIPFLRLEDDTASSKRLDLWVEGSHGYIGCNQSAQNLYLQTTGVSRLAIMSDGKIGIGTESPDGLLTIRGNSDEVSTPSIRLLDGTDLREVSITNTAGDFVVSTHGDDDAIHGRIKIFESGIIDLDTGGYSGTLTNRLRITSDGKIGINNTSPLYPLHFKNAMSATPSFIHMQVTGSNTVGGGGGIQFDTSASNTDSNNGLFLAQISGERSASDNGSNTLVFKTSKAHVNGDNGVASAPKTQMVITEDGYVAIGTTNPGTKLHVQGNGNESITLRLKQGTTPGNYSSLQVGRTDGAGNPHVTDAVTGGIPISGIPGILLGSSNTSVPAVSIQSANTANGHIVFSPKGSERLRIDSSGRVKVGIITDHTAANTLAPVYIAMQTDMTGFDDDEGAATAGLLRLEETGTNNNRYHGIDLRNRNFGDIRFLNEDVGTSDRGNLVIAMPDANASDGTHMKMRFNSLTSSIQISGKGGAVAGNTATQHTDVYIATKTGVTAVGTGVGDEVAGIIRFEDIGSNNNRYHGIDIRNRNSGDVRILNLDEGVANKASLVFAVDNTGIEEAMRITSAGTVLVNAEVDNTSYHGRIVAHAPTSGNTQYKSIEIGNTSAENVDRGSTIVGQPKSNSHAPFTLIGSWDTGSTLDAYYGGGWGNAMRPAMRHRFFTYSSYPTTNGTGTESVIINENGQIEILGGVLKLGTSGSSSGHVNAYENMSFNIDTNNDQTDRYFSFHKNGADASGTELLRLNEDGELKRPKSLSQEVSTSVSSTSATSCGGFAKATYRSAYVIAQITQGSSYQVGRYLLIHDGTTVTTIEESAIATGEMLGTFEGVINGSEVDFEVTMNNASSATVITKIESIVV